MNKLGIAAVSIAAACSIVGCGGGDGGGDNQALTYSGFATAANKICTDVEKNIDTITADLNGDPTNDAPTYDKLIPALEKATKDFAALKPPAELKADFDKFNALNATQNTAAKAAQAAAKSGDKTAYQTALQAVGSTNAESNLEASKLGAGDCISS